MTAPVTVSLRDLAIIRGTLAEQARRTRRMGGSGAAAYRCDDLAARLSLAVPGEPIAVVAGDPS